MKKIFSFLAVAAFLVPGALSADECFSEKGIAANFVDILGKWKKSESRVEIDSIAGGLRFTFFTGVRERKFPVNPAKPDTPAVLGKESVEIQICPDPASGVYYHIGVNPSGTLYTARKRDTSWEPRQLKVDVKDWGKVIIEISYADLDQKKPAAGSAWKINFGHSRIMGSYSDHFSWALSLRLVN